MKFLSALVTQGSGVMGNLVVEKNGVIRTRNVPANPRSAFQAAVRATLTSFATSWRDELTEIQRAAWRAYALTVSRVDALGRAIKLTGIDLYVGGNALLVQGDVDTVTDAPTTIGALSVPNVASVIIDDSANTATFALAEDIAANVKCLLYLGPAAVSPGRAKYTGPYRYVTSITSTAGPTLAFASITVPITGEKVAWRLAFVDLEGRTCRSQSGLTTVVA